MLLFALNACSNKLDDFDEFFKGFGVPVYTNVCPSFNDAIKYPENLVFGPAPTTFISDETIIRSMSTCDLLLNVDKGHPLNSNIGFSINNSLDPYITTYNAKLCENKVALELFERDDCFPVLASMYQTVIKKHIRSKKGINSVHKEGIEMLLQSDMCMSVLDKEEKNQIMAMALAFEKKEKYDDLYMGRTYNLMVSIMLSCNYPPFVEEVVPRLGETAGGYFLTAPNGNTLRTGIIHYDDIELILKHAKQFLNEKKI